MKASLRRIARALPEGLELVERGGRRRYSHVIVWRESGEPLRSPDGRPVTLSCTPASEVVPAEVLRQVRKAIRS